MKNAAAVAVGMLALVAYAVADAPPADGLEVVHWDSISHPDGFLEVFRVVAGDQDLAAAQIDVLVDGAPVAAQWSDDDGRLAAGDAFQFVLPAYDFQRPIELVHGEFVVWRGTFGSGAGTPVD